MQVRYDDLCSRPKTVLAKMIEALGELGFQINCKTDDVPEQFETTDIKKLSDEEFEKLREAMKRFLKNDEFYC